MDYGFTEEQEMLRKAARDFLVSECPKSVGKEMAVDERGYLPDVWSKMAGLGWMGLVFPEQYGGVGADYIRSAISRG